MSAPTLTPTTLLLTPVEASALIPGLRRMELGGRRISIQVGTRTCYPWRDVAAYLRGTHRPADAAVARRGDDLLTTYGPARVREALDARGIRVLGGGA